jgi:Lon protease-like protein
VVLLPGGALPLHVFEHRYQDLVRDALATDGVFAMAHIRPGFERELEGVPPLEPMLSIGVIAAHEALEDGRSNLLLAGINRARLVKEHTPSGKAYREVEAQLVPEGPVALDDELEFRQAVMELVARVPPEIGRRLSPVVERVHGGLLADVVAATIVMDLGRRYELLCEEDPKMRLRLVREDVLHVVASLPRRPRGDLLN